MKYNVAIVGATGLVGRVLISVLEEYDFPVDKLSLFASKNSVGKKMYYRGEDILVEELNDLSFIGVDVAFFVAGTNVSKEWVPIALKTNALVIDNSRYFRLDERVPLIVPEINIDDFNPNLMLISNPNCSTIQVVIVLNALKKFGLKRVLYTTFQSVSGSGIKGIKELEDTKKGNTNHFYLYNISETCIPQIDDFLVNGYTKEEMKMVYETKKILHLPNLDVSATCVRVPIIRSHAVSVMVEFENEFSLEEALCELSKQKGLIILDDVSNSVYPVSSVANNTDNVYVGRIRKDLSSNNSLLFYCVADNLRRGAASNAVLIAKKIIENYS